MENTQKRTRLTIDLPVEMKRRLQLIAAQRDLSMREYILETLQDRMTEDLKTISEAENLHALTYKSDPPLAELWDKEKDAGYDRK